MKKIIRKSIKILIPLLMIISQLLYTNAFNTSHSFTDIKQEWFLSYINNNLNDITKNLYNYYYVIYETPDKEIIAEFHTKDKSYTMLYQTDHYVLSYKINDVDEFGWSNPITIKMSSNNQLNHYNASYSIPTDLKPNSTTNGNTLIYTNLIISGGYAMTLDTSWSLLENNVYSIKDSYLYDLYNYLNNNNYLNNEFDYVLTGFFSGPEGLNMTNSSISTYNLILLNKDTSKLLYFNNMDVYSLVDNSTLNYYYQSYHPNTINSIIFNVNTSFSVLNSNFYATQSYPNYHAGFATFYNINKPLKSYGLGTQNVSGPLDIRKEGFLIATSLDFVNGPNNGLNYSWEELDYLLNNGEFKPLPTIPTEPSNPDNPNNPDENNGTWFGWLWDNIESFFSNSFNAIIQPLISLKDWFFDTNISESQNAISDFFSNFNANTFGLTSVITAPLITINSLANNQCVGIPMELINYQFTLPCLDELLPNYFDDLIVLYRTITDGIIGYFVMVNLLKLVKDFKDPEKDNIEVLDL